MFIQVLQGKIHRATVTEANLNYVGNNDNGERLETYIIPGERGSGMICLNGAAARRVQKGDTLIIMSYLYATPEEAKTVNPKVVFVDEENKITKL